MLELLKSISKRLKTREETPGGSHIAWMLVMKRSLKVKLLKSEELNLIPKLKSTPFLMPLAIRITYQT